MNYGESNIEEIIENERQMLLDAERNYGKFFLNAFELNQLLNHFIKSVDDIEKYIFMAFLSQIKKHLLLALFSSVRRHHIQTGMNLRQVFEAGARMAYALGNKESEKFYTIGDNGIIQVPEKLKNKKNERLEKEFKNGSDFIKRMKTQINESIAHCNIAYALQNFKPDIETGNFYFSFFDENDELKTKTDLRRIGNTVLGLIDLFNGINKKYKVFILVDDFILKFKRLEIENNELKKELINIGRIKKHIPDIP